MNIFDRIGTYLQEVFLEAKKVNWPTRDEVVKYTLLVLGLSVLLAVFLGGTDFVFTRFLNRLILRQ